MEIFALLLFCPLRQLSDIQITRSYTLKLRQAYSTGIIGAIFSGMDKMPNQFFWAGKHEDDLKRVTEPFITADQEFNQQNNDEEDNDEPDSGMAGSALEELLDLLHLEAEEGAGFPAGYGTRNELPTKPKIPGSLNFQEMQHKEVHCSGFEWLVSMQPCRDGGEAAYKTTCDEAYYGQEDSHTNGSKENKPTKRPNQSDLIGILLPKTACQSWTFEEITKNVTSG